MLIGRLNDDDRVIAFSERDVCRSCPFTFNRLQVRRLHSLHFKVFADRFTVRVTTNATDHFDGTAKTRDCYRLVRTLSARYGMKGIPDDRFACAWTAFTFDDEIHRDTADDTDLFHASSSFRFVVSRSMISTVNS